MWISNVAASASPISASGTALIREVFLDALLESRDLASQPSARPGHPVERGAWLAGADAEVEPLDERRHGGEAMMRLLGPDREHEQAVVPVRGALELAMGFDPIGGAGEGLDPERREIGVGLDSLGAGPAPGEAQGMHGAVEAVGVELVADAFAIEAIDLPLDGSIPDQDGPQRLEPGDLVVDLVLAMQDPGASDRHHLDQNRDGQHRHHHDDQALHAASPNRARRRISRSRGRIAESKPEAARDAADRISGAPTRPGASTGEPLR